MNLSRFVTLFIFFIAPSLSVSAVELITTTLSGIWSDTSVWKQITYSPTVLTDVDYYPNSPDIYVSIEGNVILDNSYAVNSIMTGYSSGKNYIYSNAETNTLTIYNASGRTFVLRGGMSNISNDLQVECDVFATKTSDLGTGVAGFVYTDNAKDTTAAKYLTLKKSFKTTEAITVSGLGASKSYLTIQGDVESLYNGVYGKFAVNRANVVLDGNVDVANFTLSYDSALTLNGKLYAHGISGQNIDGVKIQGACVIGENSGVKIAGGYGNMYLTYGADVVVNSPEGSLIVPRYLRMDSNAKLTLNTSNPLVVKEDSPDIIAPVWLWSGTQQIILNADNHFSGFCFGTNTQLTVEIGDACKLLELDCLSVKLDSNDGHLISTNSLRFKNFRNNVVKVNSLRSETELKRIFADGYADGSFYISENGFLNAFKTPSLVFRGLTSANAPSINSATVTRNSDGSININSVGKSGWNTGIKSVNLKPNTQYTVTLKYKLGGDYTGYSQVYVRNQYSSNSTNDYANINLNAHDAERLVSFSFTSDGNGGYYKICIDTYGEALIDIYDFALYEEPVFAFAPADAKESYTQDLKNIPTGSAQFDVLQPAQGTPEVTPVMCVENFGLTENVTNAATIINQIILFCKNNGYKKVTLPKGVYRDNNVTRINFTYLTDFTFDGNGATIIFNKNLKTSGVGNFYMGSNTRFKFCNLNIDWDWDKNPLASIVEVVSVNKSGSNYVDFKFIEYDYFPNRDVRVATLSSYDVKTQSVGMEGGYTRSLEMYVGQNAPTTQWLSDNVLRVYTSDTWPYNVGDTLRMQHSYYEMGNVNMQSNKHITLENVNLYSCSGHAFVCGGTQEYMFLKNVNIVRPPNPYRRAITCTADHLHVSSSKGHLKLEDCDFSLGADDCINFHDCSVFMTEYSQTSLKTINNRNMNLYTVGSTLEFRNGDYSPTGFTATVSAVNTLDAENGIYEVVFDKSLPEVYRDGFVLFNHVYDTRNVIVRNCYFHDNRARGILVLARDVTIENCRFFHNEQGGIKFETGYTMTLWSEGYGVDNVVVRNCVFDSVNPSDSKSKDGFARDAYFGVYIKQDPSTAQTYYPILKNILIEGNTFYDTFGLAAWIASTGNLIIRDNTFVNETPRQNPLSYRGAFRVSYSSQTKILNNTYIQSSCPISAGVFYSETSNSELLIAGNKTISKPDIIIDAQPQNINLNLAPDESPSVLLQVSANSYYKKNYQWYIGLDNSPEAKFEPISGANSPTLDLSELSLSQTSYFYCLASDSTSFAKSDTCCVSISRHINQLGPTSKSAFRCDSFVWNFSADYEVEKWIISEANIQGLTFDSLTATLTGVPMRGGEYAFTLEAVTKDGVSSGKVLYNLKISDKTSQYSSWLDANFSDAEKNDENISGDLATPANDGVSNLQKYAMGFPPKSITAMADVSLKAVNAQDYDLAFDFLKAKDVSENDVAFSLEESENLVDWRNANATYKIVETLDTQELIRVGIKTDSACANKFYRLKMTRVK